MDNNTPERTQIGTHKPKYEDSPIFNYINSLSPIKPVKSTHLTQSLNSLSFASIPSVFTSPHVTAHKDSSFLRRHHLSDPSKPLVSSDKNDVDGNEENLHANKVHENASSFVPPNEHLKLVTLPQSLRYGCGSPGGDSTSHCGIAAGSVLPSADSSTKLVPYNLIVSENGVHVGEVDLSGSCPPEKKEGGTECEWESLLSDNTELVNFYPSHETTAFEGTIHNSQNREEVNDLDKSQLGDPLHPCEALKTTQPSTQPEEVSELNDIGQQLGEFDSTSTRLGPTSNPCEAMDNEPVTNLQRGLRRRCLVYEMGGARMKNFNNCSTSSSSMLLQPGEEMATIDNQLVSVKSVCKSSQRTLPGIGLHLNALTQTPNNLKALKHETLATGGLPDVNKSTGFQSPITGEETVNNLLVTASSERYANYHGNDIQGDEDGLQAPTDIAPENSDQISPKKKRSRIDVAENDGCKRCNCKKSKCLKLYCECFAAGVYCIGYCSCQECFNKPIHEETVLATRRQIELRNPLAFAPKVVRTSDPLPDTRDEALQTPASARHKRGCNCKKSSCLKKYCECYQSGVGCSINCRCEGCKNAFGTKDGLGLCTVEMETKPDEEETEKFEENVVNKDLRIPQIPNKEDHTADSPLPSTPLLISRVATQLPFASKNKLQRSFTIGPSPGLQNRPKHPMPNFLQPQPKFDKNILTIPKENYTPVVLQSNSTPISGVKTSSPNSKRVSPPQSDNGSSSSASASASSPNLKSTRKLILQSIPSFPCLNSQP